MEIQPYTARPQTFADKPVGFYNSEFVINSTEDYFINNYTLLIKTPCYDNNELPQTVPIGTLYSHERALCALILAQGSFF